MADTTQKGAPKQKAQAHLDTSHLGHGRYQQEEKKPAPAAVAPTPTPQPSPPTQPQPKEDEDWGKEINEGQEGDWDENASEEETGAPEEQEAPALVAQGQGSEPEPQEQTVQTQTPNQPATDVPASATPMSAQGFMAMIQQLQDAEKQAHATVDAEITATEQQKVQVNLDLDKKLEELRAQKMAISAWRNGSAAPAATETPRTGRRGGRRRRATSDEGTNGKSESSTARGTRRTRPKNDKTLKEAIVEVLTKRGRTDLKTIATDIEASGYKTNSKKFANTVRVQLYRLDDDGEIRIHDDSTYSLKK